MGRKTTEDYKTLKTYEPLFKIALIGISKGIYIHNTCNVNFILLHFKYRQSGLMVSCIVQEYKPLLQKVLYVLRPHLSQ